MKEGRKWKDNIRTGKWKKKVKRKMLDTGIMQKQKRGMEVGKIVQKGMIKINKENGELIDRMRINTIRNGGMKDK